MKVTLIAPSGCKEGTRYCKPAFPPLSVLTVAALTPPDVEVEVIDDAVRPVNYGTDSDLIGISTSTAIANHAYAMADRFRLAGKTVVLGGIHATALPEEASRHADAVVVGEAEGKWQSLIQDFQSGRLQRIYADAEHPAPETIPVPRRDLIKPSNYILADTVQSTRGCPFDCAFCSVGAFFGKVCRSRPVQSVAAEVERLSGKYLLFVDDNIMGQPNYAKKLFTELRSLRKRWIGQASLSMLNHPNLVELAARSGCAGLFVGMETLSNSILASIGKLINKREDYERAVALLHDHGIGVLGSFVFGFDGDDESVFDRTVEFINGAKVDAAQFSILTPFPGTKLYDTLHEQGRITDTDWSHYDGLHVVYQPERLSAADLLAGTKNAYTQVYSFGTMFRRLGLPIGSKTVPWIVNMAFRERTRRWIKETA